MRFISDFARPSLTIVCLLLGCSVGKTPPSPSPLVYVEGQAQFTMGADDHAPCERFGFLNNELSLAADENIASERIRYETQILPFCMDRHEVTIEQYEHCVLRGTCDPPKFTNLGKLSRGDAISSYWSRRENYLRFPVVGMEWQDARSYCTFRGGRLPTEIEWEYAASRLGLTDGLVANLETECISEFGELALGNCSESVLSVDDNRADVTREGVWGLQSNVSEWVSDEFDILSGCGIEQGSIDGQPFDLEDLFCVSSATSRLNRRSLDILLTADADSCMGTITAPEDAENLSCTEELSYEGSCLDDFKGCYTECGRADNLTGAESSMCLSDCFSAYDICVQPCLRSDVQIACLRLSDGQNCYPQPVCVQRPTRDSTTSHTLPSFLRTDKNPHVIKGAHFQTDRACEVRSSKRQGVQSASSIVGFRCVFEANHPRCEMAQ